MGEKEEKSENSGVKVVRTPIFNKTYATNVIVAQTDSDFRVELFNEKFKRDDEWVLHSDHLTILTASAAKKLLTKLKEEIDKYEDENGEIVVDEDRMNV